jgi:hypothetical protein
MKTMTEVRSSRCCFKLQNLKFYHMGWVKCGGRLKKSENNLKPGHLAFAYPQKALSNRPPQGDSDDSSGYFAVAKKTTLRSQNPAIRGDFRPWSHG